MPTPPATRPLLATAALLALVACGGDGVDGTYYNSRTGERALELDNGKVVWAQGLLEGADLTYEVRGDSLFLKEAGGAAGEHLAFGIEADGSLSLGMLGSLTRKRP